MRKTALMVILFLLSPAVWGGEEVVNTASLPPPPARLIAPTSGGVISGSIAETEFVWSIVEPAVKYHIELSPDREFYRLTREAYTEVNRHVFDKLPHGTYFWRVSSINATGMEGSYSPVYYFVYPEPMVNK